MSDAARTTGAPEITIGPLTLYVAIGAPVEYPRIDAAPPSQYKLVGKRGAVHYTDDGTSVRLQRTLNKVYGGSTALPLKAYITDADIMVSLAVRDSRLETLQTALGFELNENRMALDKWGDLDLTEFSLLLRGLSQSPLSRGKRLQFWYQRAVFGASEVTMQYYKTGATELPLEYTLLEGVPVLGRVEGDAVTSDSNTVQGGTQAQAFNLGSSAIMVTFVAGDDSYTKLAAKVQAAIRGEDAYSEVVCVWDAANTRFELGGLRTGDLPLPTGDLAERMGFTSRENNVKIGAKFGVVEQQP